VRLSSLVECSKDILAMISVKYYYWIQYDCVLLLRGIEEVIWKGAQK
jgi:hypothetical protein